MKTKHSKLPWIIETHGPYSFIYDADGNLIDDSMLMSKDDASYMVRAVNAYERLKEALLLIAGGKDARGNYEEVAWHMAQFAVEALAVEGEKK